MRSMNTQDNNLQSWCLQNNKQSLLNEWDYEKNGELLPSMVTKGCNKKVWWKCEKYGHEWKASICNRVKNRNCPYCGNKKVLSGFNDFQTSFPDLALEWDIEKNNGVLPSQLPKKSKTKYWWKCKKGHSWQETTNARTEILPSGNRIGCPYCSGKRVLIGFNDLATVRPDIAREWHPSKNEPLTPFEVTKGSNTKVWWLCKEGHSYQATIANRTAKNGTNCPYCNNKKVLKGYNDLLSCYPEIAAEWDYSKNGVLKPDEVIKSSHKVVYWICQKKHSWKARIYHRTKDGSGCPICAGGTSFQEQSIFYYIKKFFPDAVNRERNILNGTELDIYIPSVSTAIEFDGIYYHNTPKRVDFDNKKNLLCVQNKIQLIRIREKGLPFMAETEFLKVITVEAFNFSKKSKENLETTINKVFSILNIKNFNANIEQDELKIYHSFTYVQFEESLTFLFPDIAKEWDISKNDNISADEVKPNAKIAAWWKCQKGHEWKIAVASRTSNVKECPYCLGHKMVTGETDLQTCFPEIAEEWHPILNGSLKPSDISKSSGKKVWWKGKECGHEWQATVGNRTGINHTKCPYCSNEKLLVGFNDLKTRFPELAKEWHPTLNDELKPENIMGGTVKKVWWLCPIGHAYQASPHNRTGNNTGCPYCSNYKLLSGFNDLQTCFPEVAAEWHPDKNNDLTPNKIAKASNQKVWWKCSACENEWQATVNSRTGKIKAGCPKCRKHLRKTGA